jgi:hypothetical protein
MVTEKDFVDHWRKLRTEFPGQTEEELASLFGVEVLSKWGWPFKPSSTEECYPPVDQSFLGYYPEVGWLLDRWEQSFTPLPEEVPPPWLSLNVLPTPRKTDD